MVLTRSRRRAVLAVVAIATSSALAACGAPPSSGGNGAGRVDAGGGAKKLPACPISALGKAKGTVDVNLWYGGLGGAPGDVLVGMAKAFNKSQSKVHVTVNNQGASYEEVLRKYEGASATPSQLPQVVYLEDTALGEMVDKGQVLPAESCMKADHYDITKLLPAARAHYSVDGVLYPGYMNVSTPVIYYNKAAFKKAGLDPNVPPSTLEEIRKDAQVLKDKGVAKYPLSFKNDPWFLETWLNGIGEHAVNNDNGRTKAPTKATFDTPAAVKLFTFLQDMKKDGLLVPFAYTEGSINHYLALLPSGSNPPESAMLIETSTASSTIAQFLGGKVSASDLAAFGNGATSINIDKSALVPGTGPFPGIESPGQVYASGGSFYILNTSSPAQQAGSWEFLKYMLEPANALIWHKQGGYLPVVKTTANDPSLPKFWASDVAGQLLKPAVEQLKDTDPDQAGPLLGPYAQYLKALEDAENNVLLSGQDPASALKAAQDKINGIIKDYNGG